MIFIGADHAGFLLKEEIKKALAKKKLSFVDLGTSSVESVDYPDFAVAVAKRVASSKSSKGVLACGTGVGMCIAANKVAGVRAAVLYSDNIARLAADHNAANVACVGGREMRHRDAVKRVLLWLQTPFSKEERHHYRIRKIAALENR